MHLPSHPRLPMALAVGLVLLLAALLGLQQQATERLVESQRALQENAVQRGADHLRADVSAVFEDVSAHFEHEPGEDPRDAQWLARRMQTWPEVHRYPGLLDAAYLVTEGLPGLRLEQLDADATALHPAPWPASLAAWQHYLQDEMDRLERSPDGTLRLAQTPPPLLGETPGLVFPLLNPDPAFPAPDLSFILITLDPDRLAHAVFPDLVARHFDALADDYVVRIDTPAGRVRFQSDTTWSDGGGRPDLVMPLTWSDVRVVSASREGLALIIADRTTVVGGAEARNDAGYATVSVYHRSGSLAAALAGMRRRHLGLALGTALLLALTLGLLYVLALRTRRLGAQQVAFVAGISHELRTPVAAINALADNMTAGVVHTEAHVREYGALLLQEGRRLQDMVEQVLDYATTHAQPSGDRHPIEFAAFLQDTLAREVARLAPAEVNLIVAPEAADGVVLGDADALAIAFRNVLGNAVKHGSAEGPVTIRLDAVPGTRRPSLRLRIADRGPGIPVDERERVFEPFFRGARARSEQVHGNGLGLSLVRRIVTAHGGHVHVEAAPGGGTAIVIDLPLASDTP